MGRAAFVFCVVVLVLGLAALGLAALVDAVVIR